jgi:hypothetical protein
MVDSVFGDPGDWAGVLSLLARLKKEKKLDDYQRELLLLLRNRENWKLREAVLESVNNLESPSNEFLEEILNIMMDDMSHYNARILAADAFVNLFQHGKTERERNYAIGVDVVIEKMRSLLKSPQPGFLHEAILRCIEKIKKSVE